MSKATLQEQDLLNIFRGRISSLALDPEQSHEQHLLRWIRAREGDISKAEEMLRRHTEWRKAHGIGESLLEWKAPPFLTDNYRAKFCGFDDSGCPILLFTFGIWDLRPALGRGEKDNLIRYKDQALEMVMRIMRLYENQRRFHNLSTLPEKVTQFNCICDWTGFSVRYVFNKEAVEVILEACRSFEANYPETLKAAFNVNCPKVFDVLFKLVKPFLSEHTLSKIFIYDSNEAKWKADLLAALPSDQIPTQYGGTRERMWDFSDLNLDLNQDGSFFGQVFPDKAAAAPILESDFELNGFKRIQVEPHDNVSIPIVITSPRSSLQWNVKLESPEDKIDFAISCENGDSGREMCHESKQTNTDSGSIQLEKVGNYWVVFSNSSAEDSSSSSNEAAKSVMYKLTLDIADGEQKNAE